MDGLGHLSWALASADRVAAEDGRGRKKLTVTPQGETDPERASFHIYRCDFFLTH